jgi:hypothetical protein
MTSTAASIGKPNLKDKCLVLCRKSCIPAVVPIAPPKRAVSHNVLSEIRYLCFIALFLSTHITTKPMIFIMIYAAKKISIFSLSFIEKAIPKNGDGYFNYLLYCCFATLANSANAAASATAKSASILRFTSIPASFKPCIKRL